MNEKQKIINKFSNWLVNIGFLSFLAAIWLPWHVKASLTGIWFVALGLMIDYWNGKEK